MAGTGAQLPQTEYRPSNSQCPSFRRRPKRGLDADTAFEFRRFPAGEKFRDATEPAAAECGGLLCLRFSLEPRPKQRAPRELAPAGRLFACKRMDRSVRRRGSELSGKRRV